MLLILEKEHPEIAISIKEKIKKDFPEQVLSDLSEIKGIVDSFIRIKGISSINWVNNSRHNIDKGKKRISDIRELLVGVVLMFYQPEKIIGLSMGNTRGGVMQNLSQVLDCSNNILSKSTANAIVAFKTYKDFKEEVYSYYYQIIDDLQLFK